LPRRDRYAIGFRSLFQADRAAPSVPMLCGLPGDIDQILLDVVR
jgi:hypothetical protein